MCVAYTHVFPIYKQIARYDLTTDNIICLRNALCILWLRTDVGTFFSMSSTYPEPEPFHPELVFVVPPSDFFGLGFFATAPFWVTELTDFFWVSVSEPVSSCSADRYGAIGKSKPIANAAPSRPL